uniref:Uncharacterized protein n=1 Tax=Avena sativa TaxID=4498 RepID=A0ACD5VE56_AVESA
MSPPSAPQRVRRPPPALDDDALSEIFLRLPPEDPKSLVRASAVCATWRRVILSDDGAFDRLYRAFHGAPPMLGFLQNTTLHAKGRSYLVSNFVSTATFRPPACHERRRWRALDSRHGLALFHTPDRAEDFVVCDLLTYDRWRIKASRECSHIISHDANSSATTTWNAAVLCAKDRCDHLHCHGGPFLVALAGCDEGQGTTFASVYSSQTRKWSRTVSILEPEGIDTAGHVAVAGGKAYFQCKHTVSIVEYDMGEQELSVIDPRFDEEDRDLTYPLLMGVEDDGMLLMATVSRPRLYLWSMEVVSPSRAGDLSRCRVIELEPLLPPRALFAMSIVGFAEGIGVIFLSTEAGLYTVELSSGRSKKVQGVVSSSLGKLMPYMSFYTREWGRSPTSE